ncbi:hypothetical protein Tco_0873072, partial [Tanacetum coccineum]
GDSVERVITTVSSLDATQDSDNIIRTQTTAMPNVDIPHEWIQVAIPGAKKEGSSNCGDPQTNEMSQEIRKTKAVKQLTTKRMKYRQFESSDDDLDKEDASKQGRGSDKIKPILCNFTLCLWMLEAEEESTIEFELIKIIKSMLEE